jgi:hypothetical protein
MTAIGLKKLIHNLWGDREHTGHERLDTFQREQLWEDGKEKRRINDNMVHCGEK